MPERTTDDASWTLTREGNALVLTEEDNRASWQSRWPATFGDMRQLVHFATGCALMDSLARAETLKKPAPQATLPDDPEDYLMKVEALVQLHLESEGLTQEARAALDALYADLEILNGQIA